MVANITTNKALAPLSLDACHSRANLVGIIDSIVVACPAAGALACVVTVVYFWSLSS